MTKTKEKTLKKTKESKSTNEVSNTEKKSFIPTNNSYGSIVFGVGLLIAIIASFLKLSEAAMQVVAATLIIFGIVIGFVNISSKETIPFLISIIVFVSLLEPFLRAIVQTLRIINPQVLQILGFLFANLMLLLVPAAIVVALKVILITAKDEN